jgi:hypothetical protein
MKPRHFAGIVLTFISIIGCIGPQPDEVLLPRTEISLTIKGEEVMEHDPLTYQIGYNRERNEFRLVKDNISDWMIFRSNATPSNEGQEVKASLEYTSQSSTKTLTDLTFSVERTAPDGTVWLWNKDKKIGIVIRVL